MGRVADDGGDVEFAGDHGGVGDESSGCRDEGTGEREDRIPRWSGAVCDDDITWLDEAQSDPRVDEHCSSEQAHRPGTSDRAIVVTKRNRSASVGDELNEFGVVI